jgi:phenylacetate-CoA ligase
MYIYTKFVSNVLFPLHEWLKGHRTVQVRRFIEDSQWWSHERLRDLQLQRLREMLAKIGKTVPYYRNLFSNLGFKPEHLTSLDELRRLPFLTKEIIRKNIQQLKAEDSRDLARFNTGGSTGEPLVFFISRERISHDVAAKWRATRWWGVDIGDPEVVVWGSSVELGAQNRLRSFRDRVFRTKLLPAFEMSNTRLDNFIREIRAMRPRMLFGYPSVLSYIAHYAEKQGQRMDDLGICVAFVTAERLYDDQRDQIAKTFGCRVANGYGGRDAGFIAHECPEGRLHITTEDILLEIINDLGEPLPPGQPGEIVVTHLATKDFPFVRYRTGDVGVLDDKSCPCGRGLPVLKAVEGRTTDFIVTPDGRVMHALALIYVIRNFASVGQFKIMQESRDHIRVLLVPNEAFTAHTEEAISRGLRKRLGDNVKVTIEIVDAIAAEASGKYRYVVSHAS